MSQFEPALGYDDLSGLNGMDRQVWKLKIFFDYAMGRRCAGGNVDRGITPWRSD